MDQFIQIPHRYNNVTKTLSNNIISTLKHTYISSSRTSKTFNGVQIYFDKGETVPDIHDANLKYIHLLEVECVDLNLDFYLEFRIQWIEGLNDTLLAANVFNCAEEDSVALPLIEIAIQIDPTEYPIILEYLSYDLRNSLRHEIEHLTQSGWNTKQGKYIPDDKVRRQLIESGALPAYNYYILPKEVDANIQGIYLQARKERKLFKQSVNEYLNRFILSQEITKKQKEIIINIWSERLKSLGIQQEIL